MKKSLSKVAVRLESHHTLTTEQLSARWEGAVLAGTIENWRGAGMGPKYVKLGKGKNAKVIYKLKDVMAFEKENTITPKAAK